MERFIYKLDFHIIKMVKISLKLLLVLAINPDGLCYREISGKTGYHLNTVSRQVSELDDYGLIEIDQHKSGSIRGKKWVNVVRLKKEFANPEVARFISRIAVHIKCQLNDFFVG